MPDEEKIRQEEASLRKVDDSFKKIVIVGEDIVIRHNEAGITTMGIYDFLLYFRQPHPPLSVNPQTAR